MKVAVVYESHWGNTEAIARAIAEGIGPDATALTTDEATPEATADAALIVAGAPVIGFSLGSPSLKKSLEAEVATAPTPPDLSHPAMRAWLDELPHRFGRSAAFETRVWWSPGGATGTIERSLEKAGYPPLAKAQRFVVKGKYGPLKDGELERARAWGATLARQLELAEGVAVAT